MYNYSKNKKLECALNGIQLQITECFETTEEMISELRRYKKEFPREVDYNFAQYGNLLVYYNEIYTFYRLCGYKSMDKFSTSKIWKLYKGQVGFVIDRMWHGFTTSRHTLPIILNLIENDKKKDVKS